MCPEELNFSFKVSEKVLNRFFALLQEAEEEEARQEKDYNESPPEWFGGEEFSFHSGGWDEEMAYHALCLLRSLPREADDEKNSN